MTADPWAFDYPDRLDKARGLLLAALDAIDGKRYGVSPTDSAERVSEIRDTGPERKTAPTTATTVRQGLTSRSDLTGKEAGVIMLDAQPDATPEAHQDDTETLVEHLRTLLARSIKTRDHLVSLIDKHWYVDDGDGNCLACNLPEINGRHAERAR